jgi:CHAT domain-containing protein
VQLVNLGKAREIDEAVAAASRQLQKPPAEDAAKDKVATAEPLQRALEQLSGRLLKPLWSSLAKFDHWIICPDGTPWLVPWSALIIPEKENDHNPYVVEKFRVSLVTNGRDLIEKPIAVSGNAPLMFANPDFDLLDSNIAASSPADGQLWFNRGAKSRSADISTNWSRLAGTAQEAQLVAPVLQKYVQHAPQLLQGVEATEAAFKAAWRPRVVLLSTHGFFLPAPIIAFSSPVNPLLRCGLVLSGANRLELRLQQNHDDGIVTGLEVLSTDLRGTELVVLSACETGLGELYAGEGVAGLRQAFQLAGARSVVATLWQIPDQETAWLMNFFFEQLAAGADKAAALQEAQKTLLLTGRKNGESSAHPYYWAAFTMTGDWRVSDVGPATPRPDRPAPLPLVEVTVEYARVMDGAKVATHVRLGERLPRGQQNGEWVQVYYEPGSKRSGWIPRNQVRDVR